MHLLMYVLRVSGDSHGVGDCSASRMVAGAGRLFTGDPLYALSANSCEYVTFSKS